MKTEREIKQELEKSTEERERILCSLDEETNELILNSLTINLQQIANKIRVLKWVLNLNVL